MPDSLIIFFQLRKYHVDLYKMNRYNYAYSSSPRATDRRRFTPIIYVIYSKYFHAEPQKRMLSSCREKKLLPQILLVL